MNTLTDFKKLSTLIFKIAALDLDDWCSTGFPKIPPKKKFEVDFQSQSGFNPLERLAWVAASSKPLPPKVFSLTIAGVIINELEESIKLSRFLPDAQAKEVLKSTSSFAQRTIEDCGTNRKEEAIAKLLKRLKKKLGGEIDLDPQPWLKEKFSQSEIFTIGAAILNYTSSLSDGSFNSLSEKLQGVMKDSFSQIFKQLKCGGVSAKQDNGKHRNRRNRPTTHKILVAE